LTATGFKEQEQTVLAAVLGQRQAKQADEVEGTGTAFLQVEAKPFSMEEFLSEKQE
jgi:hypothetical protein